MMTDFKILPVMHSHNGHLRLARAALEAAR